jgi:hypothetical protein
VGVAFVGARRGGLHRGPLALGRLAVGTIALGIRVAVRGWCGVAPRYCDRRPGLLLVRVLQRGAQQAERNLDAGTAAMLVAGPDLHRSWRLFGGPPPLLAGARSPSSGPRSSPWPHPPSR